MPDLVGIAERVRLGLVTATPSVWSRGVSWLCMAKVQRRQYGVDRIEDGGWVVLKPGTDVPTIQELHR